MLRETNDLIQRLNLIRERLRFLEEESARYGFLVPPSLRIELEHTYDELVFVSSRLSQVADRQAQDLSDRLRYIIQRLEDLQTEFVRSMSPFRRLRLRNEIRKASEEIQYITDNLSRLVELRAQMEIDRARALLAQGQFEEAAQIANKVLEVDNAHLEARDLYVAIAEAIERRSDYAQAACLYKEVTSSYERAEWRRALELLEMLSALEPSEQVADLRDRILHQLRSAKELREQSLLSLYAIARTELEEGDWALVGQSYSIQAGVAQSKPEDFQAEPFDLMVDDMAEPVVFDILLHPGENIELATDWHKRLVYKPLNPQPQLIEFTFQVIASGHHSVTLDFYHKRRWLRTIRFEFDSVEAPELAAVST